MSINYYIIHVLQVRVFLYDMRLNTEGYNRAQESLIPSSIIKLTWMNCINYTFTIIIVCDTLV